MSVLDIGTGVGDVAILAGWLVGSTGRVLGIDLDTEVLELARRRAAATEIGSVVFEAGSLGDQRRVEGFDFVVGRLVAVHQPDRIQRMSYARSWVTTV